MIIPTKANAFGTINHFILEGKIMLKKLVAIFKNLKKESKASFIAGYEKKYGTYTAGYRHKTI